MKYLGHKLKTLRELHNYKQQFVGDFLGIGQSAYSRIENGSPDNVPLKYIDKLAELYGVRIEELFSPDSNILPLGITIKPQEENSQLPETRLKMLEEKVEHLISKFGY